MPANSDPRQLYTMLEVANLFRVCPKTIANWIRRGELNATKIGTSVRILGAHIDDLLARRSINK
jgi:excisionase family DNA binding protein